MNLMQRRRALMAQAATPGGRLPPEYQEVAWIEGTGTQWISTDIIPQINQFAYEVKFYKASQSAASLGIFSLFDDNNADQSFSLNFRSATNTIGIYSGFWTALIFSYLYGRDVVANVEYTATSPWVMATLTANGYSQTITATRQPTTTAGNASIILFSATKDSSKTPCRIMYCKFNGNGRTIANLIPCYKKADGDIGMYDLIGGKFYGNAGSGTFIKGADV